ncbi:hypothetical protein [Ideonella margarita]|uniref:DUF3822 family protein n=1 Tax=Ideonella margarita TaxID=2984191 RepID=A0ABU9C830_9BURK
MREYLQRKEPFEIIAARHQTEDGLIPCQCLIIRCTADGYDLAFAENPDIEVFPVPESNVVADALVNRPDLWRQAAIRLTYRPSVWGSAPIFGVPFQRAVEIALKQGYTKSKYFLPNAHTGGGYESLLIHLRKVDDKRGELLQLEAWQYKPGSDFAYYLHAMSTNFQSLIVHLDGATIQYSGRDLDTLLLETKKVKGSHYQKFFRLDGELDVNDMHKLATAFLPGEQLYMEALDVAVMQNCA